jgi:rubrerythrin
MEHMEMDRILEMAIAQESAANKFYTELGDRVRDQSTRETLEFLATEESRHREFLEAYRKGKAPEGGLGLRQVVDAHLAETLGAPSWKPDWRPEDAFLAAAGQEALSHEFYEKLAQLHPQGAVRDLLLELAQEELAHKEKLEYLYANTAFPQTDGG